MPAFLAFRPDHADTEVMSNGFEGLSANRRLLAYTAAAMYGCAGLDELITGVLPGDRGLAPLQFSISVVVVVMLLLFGQRLPRAALACLGPIGVILIADAIATAPQAGDAAILYVWPVLWMSFFFGRWGAAVILVTVGAADAVALSTLPGPDSYPGRWVDVMISASVCAGVVLVLVERNRRLLERLAEEARVDPLTGLLNRRGFEERAALELARSRREARPVALLMFDLDHFKRINDEWGHEVGDRVLARVGALLASQSRAVDVVARLGGEEFVVLLADGDAAEAQNFADRVREVLAVDHVGLPPVRVSVGIDAQIAPDGIELLRSQADRALYQAKRTGRDRVVISAALPAMGVA